MNFLENLFNFKREDVKVATQPTKRNKKCTIIKHIDFKEMVSIEIFRENDIYIPNEINVV